VSRIYLTHGSRKVLGGLSTGVESYAKRNGLDWTLILAPPGIIEAWRDRLRGSAADSVVIGAFTPTTRSIFRDTGIPLIACFEFPSPDDSPVLATIVPDDEQVAATAARHLEGAGARSFAVLNPVSRPGTPAWVARNRHFEAYLARRGKLVHPVDSPLGKGRRRRHVGILADLAELPAPIGIFCYQDRTALWLYDLLQSAGLRIGADALVLGCDDSDQAGNATRGLSSVRFAFGMFAEFAAVEAHRFLSGSVAVRSQARFVPVPPIGVAERASTQILSEDPLLSRALGVVRTARRPPATVRSWCRRARVSPDRLKYRMAALCGMSPKAWLAEHLLQRALHLLADTDLPLAEVVARCSFTDRSHLAKRFRQRFGCSPARFRRRMRPLNRATP